MNAQIGIELRSDAIRAVRLAGMGKSDLRTVEISWDPLDPEPGIAALRDHIGGSGRIAVAVDLRLLHVKRLDLPPLPLGERRRALGIEPDRYFAVRGEELVFAVRENDDLVFAAPEALVTSWLDALADLGRVERIEPAPISLSRAIRASEEVAEAVVLRNGTDGGVEVLEIRDGRLRSARRVYGDLPAAVAAVEATAEADRPRALYLDPWDKETGTAAIRSEADRPRPLPRVLDLDPAYLPAYGAALDLEQGWREGLITDELERSIGRRRRLSLILASSALVAAILFAVLSVDALRARTEDRLDDRLATLRAQAAPAVALQTEAQELSGEIRALAEVDSARVDLLASLRALTRRLPEGAWVRSIYARPGEWQLDGYARDAAELIPVFENDPRFEDVRFLAATSRVQLGEETYENFSLALRTVRAP